MNLTSIKLPGRSGFLRIGLIVWAVTLVFLDAEEATQRRPNILFCLSDDQSYPHAGAYGEAVIKTPVFDRVAKEGVLFSNAYCASPSCTASRSAILTGQDIWRLDQGGQLFGTLAAKHPAYTDLLEAAGYHVGYMDKGWSPGNVNAGGRTSNAAGTSYKNFEAFMGKATEGQPWCFWFGSRDPHRPYKKGSGIASGMDPTKVKVPACFPDTPEVRSDICDYFFEIQRFDRDVGAMMKMIDDAGQLDNTLIIITSDNGMPFPRAKANLYDLGTRMPLAIRWPGHIPPSRTVDDFVNLTDLAPTFLEAAGITPPEAMTGRSLMSLLGSGKSGIIEPARDSVVTGRERHAWCRLSGESYPMRMIRTRDFLYIRNGEPDRWPAGDFRVVTNEGSYGDIDASPTKDVMIAQKDQYPELFELAFGKRPTEELYDCRKDSAQLHNLASDPTHEATRRALAEKLEAHLTATGDPREGAGELPWDGWPYFGAKRWKILPQEAEPSPDK
jgi:N-sulfoglucosamine sulfohydrolase